jgi:hypothetical protein
MFLFVKQIMIGSLREKHSEAQTHTKEKKMVKKLTDAVYFADRQGTTRSFAVAITATAKALSIGHFFFCFLVAFAILQNLR